MGVERHLRLRRGLRQKGCRRSPHQAGTRRPILRVVEGHQGKQRLPGRLVRCSEETVGHLVEYWWPKPGEKDGSRKLSYGLAAKGTPYAVGAGIYDDKATVAELSKLAGTK